MEKGPSGMNLHIVMRRGVNGGCVETVNVAVRARPLRFTVVQVWRRSAVLEQAELARRRHIAD